MSSISSRFIRFMQRFDVVIPAGDFNSIISYTAGVTVNPLKTEVNFSMMSTAADFPLLSAGVIAGETQILALIGVGSVVLNRQASANIQVECSGMIIEYF